MTVWPSGSWLPLANHPCCDAGQGVVRCSNCLKLVKLRMKNAAFATDDNVVGHSILFLDNVNSYTLVGLKVMG